MLCSTGRNNTEARLPRPPYRYKSASVIASIRIAPTVSVRIVIMIIVWLAKAERSHLDSEPLLRPGRARRERESTERGRGDGKGGHAAKPQPSDLAQHPDFLRRADNQSLA